MEKLIVIGAGGHSKSVCASIDKSLYELCGFLDEAKTGSHLGLPILGSDIEKIPQFQSYSYFVAIGDVDFREKWFRRLQALNLKTINIIDRTAIVADDVRLGTGNYIGKLAIINADSIIGDNNVINTKALVEHECVVGNNCHLSTNSTINGNVIVEDNVFFGSTAVCNGQLRIGEHAVVGSGTVVIKSIEPYTTVVGVPGRIVKKVGRYEQD